MREFWFLSKPKNLKDLDVGMVRTLNKSWLVPPKQSTQEKSYRGLKLLGLVSLPLKLLNVNNRQHASLVSRTLENHAQYSFFFVQKCGELNFWVYFLLRLQESPYPGRRNTSQRFILHRSSLRAASSRFSENYLQTWGESSEAADFTRHYSTRLISLKMREFWFLSKPKNLKTWMWRWWGLWTNRGWYHPNKVHKRRATGDLSFWA